MGGPPGGLLPDQIGIELVVDPHHNIARLFGQTFVRLGVDGERVFGVILHPHERTFVRSCLTVTPLPENASHGCSPHPTPRIRRSRSSRSSRRPPTPPPPGGAAPGRAALLRSGHR